MNILRNEGWIVTRAAGSHSPFDLIALKEGKIRFIQLKYGSERYLKYGFKQEEADFKQFVNGNYDVTFEFIKLRIRERFNSNTYADF